MFAYCSNNPVFFADYNGHFAITASALLLTMFISAGIGAGIAFGATAYQDYSDDGELFNGSVGIEEYAGNTLGGFITGAGVGACTALGAGLGIAMAAGEALTLGGMTLSGLGALGLGVGTAFATGAAGYATRTAINPTENFEWNDMLIAAGANAASGALSFVGGMCGGMAGVKIPGKPSGVGNSIKYHCAMAYFGVYPSKYLISIIKNALQEIF